MGTFILEYWFFTLPTVIAGIVMLRLMKRLYEEKTARKRQPVPVVVKKRMN